MESLEVVGYGYPDVESERSLPEKVETTKKPIRKGVGTTPSTSGIEDQDIRNRRGRAESSIRRQRPISNKDNLKGQV